MTEQSRIITEEQWKEYRQLKCSDRLLREQIEELNKQLEVASELLKSLLPINHWQDDAAVIDYLRKRGVE